MRSAPCGATCAVDVVGSEAISSGLEVMFGTSWCLQKFVELGVDTLSRNNAGDTKEPSEIQDLHTSAQVGFPGEAISGPRTA
eukprot:Skav213111  [mRNA]  locus=scaffold107:23462:24982:+ [translate_table: standard]